MKTTSYLIATTIAIATMTMTLTPALAEVRRPSFSSEMEAMPMPVQMQAERTIEVTPQTEWVNVKRMEVIRFVGKTGGNTKVFDWRFDAPIHRPISLSDIAPAGFVERDITIYVAPSRFAR